VPCSTLPSHPTPLLASSPTTSQAPSPLPVKRTRKAANRQYEGGVVEGRRRRESITFISLLYIFIAIPFTAYITSASFATYTATFAAFVFTGYLGDLCCIDSVLIVATITTGATSVTMYNPWTPAD
jgi:hypothetical protein